MLYEVITGTRAPGRRARRCRRSRRDRQAGGGVITSYSIHYTKLYEQVFVATPSASPRTLWSIAPLLRLDARLHSLAEDADGELYLLTTAQGIPVGNTGKVWKLVPASAR